jgi:Domain of unknown function (DUF6484)
MSSLKERKSHKRAAPISTLTKDTCGAGPADPPVTRPAEVVIGRIVGIGAGGAPLVDFPENPACSPIPTLATACYDVESTGRDVALMFISGDPTRPLAIGLVRHPAEANAASECAPASRPNQPPDCITFSAAREIVLQCGRAKIVLTQAGKLLLRGAYVSSRSSGMQRITGASVHIN